MVVVGWWLRLLGIWRLPEKPKREEAEKALYSSGLFLY